MLVKPHTHSQASLSLSVSLALCVVVVSRKTVFYHLNKLSFSACVFHTLVFLTLLIAVYTYLESVNIYRWSLNGKLQMIHHSPHQIPSIHLVCVCVVFGIQPQSGSNVANANNTIWLNWIKNLKLPNRIAKFHKSTTLTKVFVYIFEVQWRLHLWLSNNFKWFWSFMFVVFWINKMRCKF